MSNLGHVSVVYCTEDQQYLIQLPYVAGMTALDAVQKSGLQDQEILPEPLQLGIFSLKVEQPSEYKLQEGDRVEIYRPLKFNPKDVRRRRAQQNPVGRFQKGNRWNRQQKSTE